MAKVIQFPKTANQEKKEKEIETLKLVSDQLDDVILEAILEKNLDPKEVAGIIAHRLGSLMRKLESKDDLWDVCERVAKKQAAIED